MTAEIIDIIHEPQRAISEASRILNDGFPVAIPTETVYGLAADATRADAISRIYETKGRPQFNPLICHVCDIEMAERYAVFDPVSRRLAETFWPGPLTIVLPLKKDSAIHPLATAGLETVGLRCPDGYANELIRAFDRPLAAPSANTSGKISPTAARHVMEDLGDKLQLIVNGGVSPIGVESTIVDLSRGELGSLGTPELRAAEAARAAQALGVELRIAKLVESIYAEAATIGLGERDFAAIADVTGGNSP